MDLCYPGTKVPIPSKTMLYQRVRAHLAHLAETNPGLVIDPLLTRIIVDFSADKLAREHLIRATAG